MIQKKLEDIIIGGIVAAGVIGAMVLGVKQGIEIRKDIAEIRLAYSENSQFVGPCFSGDSTYYAFENNVYLKGPEKITETPFTSWGDSLTTLIYSGESLVCERQYSR